MLKNAGYQSGKAVSGMKPGSIKIKKTGLLALVQVGPTLPAEICTTLGRIADRIKTAGKGFTVVRSRYLLIFGNVQATIVTGLDGGLPASTQGVGFFYLLAGLITATFFIRCRLLTFAGRSSIVDRTISIGQTGKTDKSG
jgi:hypothetical protein